MPLVNAFQNSAHDVFHHDPHVGETSPRFMKIRSVWPFPVRGTRQVDTADSEPSGEEIEDSVAPSSFIT